MSQGLEEAQGEMLPLSMSGDEPANGNRSDTEPSADSSLMALVLEPDNLRRAYQKQSPELFQALPNRYFVDLRFPCWQ